MSLPILTTGEDVSKLVDYLKTKSTGATTQEVGAALGKNLIDGRKISAYEFWGVVSKDGGRFVLTQLGRELSRAMGDNKAVVFQKILRAVRPYNGAIEWFFHQKLESVTGAEIGGHWFQNYKADIGKPSETTLGYMAVCFMNLCDAAGIGTLTIGRKGRPTRLDLEHKGLQAYIEGTSPSLEYAEDNPETAGGSYQDEVADVQAGKPDEQKPKGSGPIFIAHGKNKKALDQLKKILDQFKIPYKIAVDEPHSGRPISQKVSDLMHECGSAIFIFTAEAGTTNKEGKVIPNSNVVFELGAASVLYGKRIIIFKEEDVAFPSDFSDLGYISFEKENLEARTTDLLKELIEMGFVKITSA